MAKYKKISKVFPNSQCKTFDTLGGAKFDYNMDTLGRGPRDKTTCNIW